MLNAEVQRSEADVRAPHGGRPAHRLGGADRKIAVRMS